MAARTAAAPRSGTEPAGAPPFAEIVRCGEAPGGWCVQPESQEGKAVLGLGKSCRGVTLARGRVKWTDCAHPEAGDLAVVGTRVEGYRPLKVERVKDAPTLERLEALLRGQKDFEPRLARVEARLRKAYAAAGRHYEPPELGAEALGGRGWLATFDPEGGDALPYLVLKARVTPVTSGPERCAAVKDVFLAGGKAWLRLSDCACGTDACRATFWALE